MADRLTTKINRLKRDVRSLRRWVALELGLAVLVVGLAAAAGVWLWQVNTRRDAAIEPVGEGPVTAAPTRAPPVRSSPPNRQAEPDTLPEPATSAHFGVVEIVVERAALTNMVLTEFFGLPAVDPEVALVLHIRVSNFGLTEAVRYTTMRNGNAGVVDDLGRTYVRRDYGKVPVGGVTATVIEPGGAVTDVLIFDAPATDVRYVDLVVPGQCVGASQTSVIRVPTPFEQGGPSAPVAPPVAEPVAKASRPPAAPPTPAELLEGYHRAVEKGDPEGLWNLGRAYRDGFGVQRDRRKALGYLRQAGQKNHQQAMWDAVGMLSKGDLANTRQAVRWLEKLLDLGDRQAHYELAELDPMKYCAAARNLQLLRDGPKNKTGSAVKMAGRLRERSGDTWTMVLEDGRTIDVDMSGVTDPHVAEGIYAEVCGLVNSDLAIEALVGNVPEPKYFMPDPVVAVPPGGVVGRRTTRYVVNGIVRNTGPQPIRSITLTVRVRVGSSVSPVQVITVWDLAAGESEQYSAEFTMRNPAAVKRPFAEITDHDYDW